MSMHRTAKCLTTLAMGFALSGCSLDPQTPVTNTSGTQNLITPWGPSSSHSVTAAAATTTAQNTDNLVMMEDIRRQALDLLQQKQIEEVRIALGILDRMAQRCVQGGEAAACTTLQTNWSALSQQLHKTLLMMSDEAMQLPMSGPSKNPAMPDMNDTIPIAPAMTAPTGNTNAPSLEKVIPMTEPGTDG